MEVPTRSILVRFLVDHFVSCSSSTMEISRSIDVGSGVDIVSVAVVAMVTSF